MYKKSIAVVTAALLLSGCEKDLDSLKSNLMSSLNTKPSQSNVDKKQIDTKTSKEKEEELKKQRELALKKQREYEIKQNINKDFEQKISKLNVIDREVHKHSNKIEVNMSGLTWVKMPKKASYFKAKKICKNFTYKHEKNWRWANSNELEYAQEHGYQESRKQLIVPGSYPWGSDSARSYMFWADKVENGKVLKYNKNSMWSIGAHGFYTKNGTSVKGVYAGASDKLDVICVTDNKLDDKYFKSARDYRLYSVVKDDFRSSHYKKYSKKPFVDIQRIVQQLTNIYLSPRNIKEERIPRKISKPSLPTLPKFVKGEYETKKQLQDRVNKAIEQRENEIIELQAQYRQDVEERNQEVKDIHQRHLANLEMLKAEQEYKKSVLPQKISQYQKKAFEIVMGGFKFEKRSYDTENEILYLTMKAKNAKYSKKIILKIKPKTAQNFVSSLSHIDANPKFEFANNQITLKELNTRYEGQTFSAILNDKDYKPERIVVAIKDKKVDFKSAKQTRLSLQNPNLKDTYQVEALAYKDGKKIKDQKFSDDIPSLLKNIKAAKIDKKKWLFIIGIENYNETDNIKFSKRSATAFKKVAKKTLGIQERNVYTLIDSKATGTAIQNKLALMLKNVKKGDTIYFYYNGHGVPNPKLDNEPFLLPSDEIPDFVTNKKEFALKNLYKKLSDSKANKVVAFVDSCFSGATDGVSLIKGVAASRLAPKKVKFNKSKMVVLTAGQKKQYSNMYKEKGHRMFSYFLMKSLLNGKKDIKRIFTEVSHKVSEKSHDLGDMKKQEPTISGITTIRL